MILPDLEHIITQTQSHTHIHTHAHMHTHTHTHAHTCTHTHAHTCTRMHTHHTHYTHYTHTHTPLLYMICVPSCALEEYTSLPSTLLSAPTPVRMMCEFFTWITCWPRRSRYAPIPMVRQVTCRTGRIHTQIMWQ